MSERPLCGSNSKTYKNRYFLKYDTSVYFYNNLIFFTFVFSCFYTNIDKWGVFQKLLSNVHILNYVSSPISKCAMYIPFERKKSEIIFE